MVENRLEERSRAVCVTYRWLYLFTIMLICTDRGIFSNGIHIADKTHSPNISPITTLITSSALDGGTHEVFCFVQKQYMVGKGRKEGKGRRSGRIETVRRKKGRKQRRSYLVNWRSLASMLRCLMHILVRAEPISLVAPGNTKQPGSYDKTHTHTDTKTSSSFYVPHKAAITVYITAISVLCQVKALHSSHSWKLPSILSHSASIYTRHRSAVSRYYTQPGLRPNKVAFCESVCLWERAQGPRSASG